MANLMSRHDGHRSCFAAYWRRVKTPTSACYDPANASFSSESGLRGLGSWGSDNQIDSSTRNSSNISCSNSKLLQKLQKKSISLKNKVEGFRSKAKAVDSWVRPRLKDLLRPSCCSSDRLLQQVDNAQPAQRAAEAAMAAYQHYRRSSATGSDKSILFGSGLYTISEDDCPDDSEVDIVGQKNLLDLNKVKRFGCLTCDEGPELDVKEMDTEDFTIMAARMGTEPEALPELKDVTVGPSAPTRSTNGTEGTEVTAAGEGYGLDTETKLFLLVFGVLASMPLLGLVLVVTAKVARMFALV